MSGILFFIFASCEPLMFEVPIPFVFSGDCNGIRIVTRAEWGARSPTSVSYLSLPVPYAFVHHTEGSTCSSVSSCSSVVRGIQNYHMDSLGNILPELLKSKQIYPSKESLRGVEWVHGLFLFPLVLGKM